MSHVNTKIFARRSLTATEIDSVAADWLKADLEQCADGEVLDAGGPVGCDFDGLDHCKERLGFYGTLGSRDDDELSAVAESYREQLARAAPAPVSLTFEHWHSISVRLNRY